MAGEAQALRPFLTISRQAGVGAHALGDLLAKKLNSAQPPDHPWQCLDRQLVERIAADHHLSTELIEGLEKSSHTWISEFLRGLSLADRGSPSELAVFRRVVETVHALARAGYVILVGLGGVLITRHMLGVRGVHVRVVAPFEWRVKTTAKFDQITEPVARERVKLADRDREAFFAKFWPHTPISSELFHMTLNASMMSEEEMADSILPLVLHPQHASLRS
jgi:hypothetical protein